MMTQLANLLSGASPAKASLVSATVHVVGLGLLGGYALDQLDPAEAPGGHVVVQWQRPAPKDDDPQATFATTDRLADDELLVMPSRARVASRWMRRATTDEIVTEALARADAARRVRELDNSAEQREDPAEPQRSLPPPRRLTLPLPPPTAVADRTYLRNPDSILENDSVRPPAMTASPRPTVPQADSTAETPSYGDAPPRFTFQPAPVYPQGAARRREAGTTLIELQIRTDGTVAYVRVARSSGYPTLDAAAVTAIRSWRCQPRTRAGQPVASTERIPVHFRLR